MARAKRTDRAEARRRYRAQLAADEAAGAVDAEATETPAAVAPSRGRPTPRQPERQPAAPPRSGMVYAFRAAFRPANLREDLAQLPSILLSRALLIPLLVTVVTAIVFRATSGRELISVLLWQYFVFPPPIGSIFITGFFAKRASYLNGLIVGVVAAVAFTLVVASAPAGFGAAGTATASPSPAASAAASTAASVGATAGASVAPASAEPSPAASPAPVPLAPVDAGTAAAQAFVIAPIGGIVFASLAAWYRRFLKLANPNRGAPRPAANRGRPARRR